MMVSSSAEPFRFLPSMVATQKCVNLGAQLVEHKRDSLLRSNSSAGGADPGATV